MKTRLLRTLILLSGLGLLTHCGDKEKKAPADSPDPSSSSEANSPPKKNGGSESPVAAPDSAARGMVAIDLLIDGALRTHTGLMTFAPGETTPSKDRAGTNRTFVFIPDTGFDRRDSSIMAKFSKDEGDFSQTAYLTTPVASPDGSILVLQTIFNSRQPVVTLPTAPPSLKDGMKVVLLSAAEKPPELSGESAEGYEARKQLDQLRGEITVFAKGVEWAPNFRMPNDRWGYETAFIENSPVDLSPEQYGQYQDLRGRLMELRKALPASDPSMKGRTGSAFRDSKKAFQALKTNAAVKRTRDGETTLVASRGSDAPPESLTHLVVSGKGALLGMARNGSESGSFQFVPFDGANGLKDPVINSVKLSMDVSKGAERNLSVRFEADASVGLSSFASFHAVVIPSSEEASFPAGEGVPAIFNPTDSKISQRTAEFRRPAGPLSAQIRNQLRLPPGEERSFTGQLFAKDPQGTIRYFEPFRWTVAASRSEKTYRISVEDHPFAELLSFDPPKDETGQTAFSEPANLPYPGMPLEADLNGRGDIVVILTDEAPFIFAANLETSKVVPVDALAGRESAEGVSISASGDHLYILDPDQPALLKWSLTQNTLLETKALPASPPYRGLTAASANEQAPLMLVSHEGVHFRDPSTLEPTRVPFQKNIDPKEPSETFSHEKTPGDGDEFIAISSGDGKSYFVRIRKNDRDTGFGTLFRPFAKPGMVVYRTSSDAHDLGFNGDIIMDLPAIRSLFDRKAFPKSFEGNLFASNRGGEGFFTHDKPQRREPDIPAAVPLFRLYLPGDPAPILTSDRLPELARVEFSPRNQSIFFVPASNRLITVPASGGEVIFRTVGAGESAAPTLRITSTQGIRATPGGLLTHQLSFLGRPAGSRLVNPPPGASYDVASHTLTWKVPTDYGVDETTLKFEVDSDDGKPLSHAVTAHLVGDKPALLTKGMPYRLEGSRREFESAEKSIGIASSVVDFPNPIADVVPTAGGEFLAVTFEDTPRVDLVNVATAEIAATAYLSADAVMMAANRNHLFCYYPGHHIIEKRDARTLAILQTAVLPIPSQLITFETGMAASDETPIFCVQQRESWETRTRTRLIDPVSLQFLPSTAENAFLDASGDWYPRDELFTNHFPISPDGRIVLPAGFAVEIGSGTPRRMMELRGYDNKENAVSSAGRAVFSKSTQLLIPSKSIISRAARKLQWFKTDQNADTLIGFTIQTTSMPKKPVVEFFTLTGTEPLLSLHQLGEFDSMPPSSRDKFEPLPPHRRISYFSGLNRLVTIPWDDRRIVIREIDVQKAVSELR